MHATDWLPTIVEGIAGLELDGNRWALDGYHMLPTITTNSEHLVKKLINLDPPCPEFVGQAAIRVGEWKLITVIKTHGSMSAAEKQKICKKPRKYMRGHTSVLFTRLVK